MQNEKCKMKNDNAKFKIGILIVLVILTFTVFANVGLAADEKCSSSEKSTLWDGIDRCRACGDCKLNDFIQIAVNVSRIILGVVGSLALAMFVYGGLMMIISQGSSDKVTKARTILTNAVIGLVIVFTAWSIINFVYTALDVENKATWHQAP